MKYEIALMAIKDLVSDKSVSQEEIKINLKTLIDEIEIMIEVL